MCIEYARESTRDEQYPWVCLYKAVAVTDNLLGARSQVWQEAAHSAGQHIWCPLLCAVAFSVMCILCSDWLHVLHRSCHGHKPWFVTTHMHHATACLQMARDRFNEFLQMASVPADDADVDKASADLSAAAPQTT